MEDTNISNNTSVDKIVKRDSFAERRKLFKNIWETAVTMDDKEAENAKPKVIKTLRLGDMDCINIGKNKKQRIKNLRTVCTRLLDFCDRQDAEDMYQRMSPTRHDSDDSSVNIGHPPKGKKKRVRKKKKIHRTFSYVPNLPMSEPDRDKFKMSFDCKEEGPITHRGTRPQRDTSSPRLKRAFLIQQFLTERFNLEHPPPAPISPVPSEKLTDAPRKVVKKKQRKRKKTAVLIPPPLPRVISAHNKKVLTNGMKKK